MSYPKNLTYLAKKLSGYSRQTYKLQTTNQTKATAGQIVTVDLPSNALVDLSTLTWFFKGKTTTGTGNALFPRNIETIIERLEVEINGQLVGQGCQFYNHLWQIISDTTFGEDVINRRRVLQNSSNAGNIATSNDNTARQFAIQNWLGFLGSAKPNVLDTSLLGNVRIRITLASPVVLITQTSTTNPGYELDDMFFSVDTISIDDGVFYNIHNQFLASGGVYEIPFNNFLSFSSSASGSCKFSLSTQSLDRVWATFVAGTSLPMNATDNRVSTTASTSSYFHRLGNAVTQWGPATNNTTVTYNLQSWQFNINNQYYPNYRPSAEQAYALMLNSYGLSQDTLGGGHTLLNGISTWNNGFWVASENFNHNSDDFISGIDTRGNVVQAYFEFEMQPIAVDAGTGYTQAPNTRDKLTCLVFAQTTSTLRVGAGKQIELQM